MVTKYENQKTVWMAMINTDLTEGKGRMVAIAVSDSETTVKRFGKGKNVQGSDAEIVSATAYYINASWYYPYEMALKPTADDLQTDELRKRVSLIEHKLKANGLTDEDLALYARVRAKDL